ncbi:hypothetical protein AVEN_104216-1 [Araneus ventricosus]|uniref:Uncharacterized protein n=1 Tax=Araneus ventricosus TaxID=182803 RepID=A0A4Y2JVP9_ARAVE|nr:hypothetical protein AVEN_104216-1 [Araneus ventricosus]
MYCKQFSFQNQSAQYLAHEENHINVVDLIRRSDDSLLAGGPATRVVTFSSITRLAVNPFHIENPENGSPSRGKSGSFQDQRPHFPIEKFQYRHNPSAPFSFEQIFIRISLHHKRSFCEDSRTAAKIGPAKVATWMVGKTPKENSPNELLFTPYLVTLGTQNRFGNSQLRRSDGCPFSVQLRRDYP